MAQPLGVFSMWLWPAILPSGVRTSQRPIQKSNFRYWAESQTAIRDAAEGACGAGGVCAPTGDASPIASSAVQMAKAPPMRARRWIPPRKDMGNLVEERWSL